MKKLYLIICCFALNANAMYTDSVWGDIDQEETHISAPYMGVFTAPPAEIGNAIPRPTLDRHTFFAETSIDDLTSYDGESNSTDE